VAMVIVSLKFLFLTLALSLAACAGEAAPMADIEATVDARVAQELDNHDTHDHNHAIADNGQQSQSSATETKRAIIADERVNSSSVSPNDAPGSGPITVSKFTILSTICEDEHGPDCSRLRLGDDYLTTSAPAIGYLYSCNGKNPSAPGSDSTKISWINLRDKTWNFFKKPWLPKGGFDPQPGFYKETLLGNDRQIQINSLPVDRMIGDWPMTNYRNLTRIDRNPGIPAERDQVFFYPLTPSQSSSPTCVSLGSIGVTTNGVVIYNAVDGRGEDAVAREILDEFGGHPAQDAYHYHFIPDRLDNEVMLDGHSGVIGYMNDGFPIYGYRGVGGIEMANNDLDQCHGHNHGVLGYHYHATIEYPYTIGCYAGTPIQTIPDQGMQQPGQRNQGRQPSQRNQRGQASQGG
jgi:hypothetical protein